MRSSLVFLLTAICLLSRAQVESRLLSPLPDQARDDAIGFAIDGIGYIQGGRKADFGLADQLWAYDPSMDQWTIRMPLPGITRQYSSSFVLDGKGYLFCGLADPGQLLHELWQYDPASDTWSQLNDFPGGGRFAPVSFTLNDIAYAGLGKGEDVYYDDLWQYDAAMDSWSIAAQFPMALYSGISFSLLDEEVIGFGLDAQEEPNSILWSFDGQHLSQSNTCTEGIGFADAVQLDAAGLVIGGRSANSEARDGVVAIEYLQGVNGFSMLDCKAESGMAGGAKRNGASFAIGDRGYYFGGKDELGLKSNDLVEFSLKEYQQEIKVYPNPATSRIQINSNEPFKKVEVFDLLGKMILRQDLEVGQYAVALDLRTLASGSYLLRLDGNRSSRFMLLE